MFSLTNYSNVSSCNLVYRYFNTGLSYTSLKTFTPKSGIEILILVFQISDSTDRHWIGMWWGGFLICGACLLLISVPFFFYPKELKVI